MKEASELEKKGTLVAKTRQRIVGKALSWRTNQRIGQLTRQINRRASLKPAQPVLFFNASTRLGGVSQNAAFAFLTALGLQLAGVPVIHFACMAGMSRCPLGTDRDDAGKAPPCRPCMAQSRWLYASAPVVELKYRQDALLANALQPMSVEAMAGFEIPFSIQGKEARLPLGPLTIPALRWVLRRHHLQDDDLTRRLLREYILSADQIARQFSTLLEQTDPATVVVFNGIMFPEATARWVAQQRGLRVITHEVGLQPFTAFFSDGDATAYPIDIPDDFELSPAQNNRLDSYLGQRFQGNFSMAGIRFWPQIQGLSAEFLQRSARFKQIVPVFTNVIFDTSQVHANRVFPHMFAWLDQVAEIASLHPETLFVIRAHPDELRPGKESRENVRDWVAQKRLVEQDNVIFVSSTEYLSSYELIQRAKFVMVYNSSIGLEASLMGAAVLCAGKARYTQLTTVFFPQSVQAFREQAEAFLAAEQVIVPDDFIRNARRFLYYQLFRTSLPFGEYLEPHPTTPGYVRFRPFPIQKLQPDQSTTMRVLVDGITLGQPFLLPEDDGQASQGSR